MPRRLVALLGAVSVVACGTSSVEPKPQGGPYVVLHVIGSVRTPSGDPVAGATLEIWARGPLTCTGGFAEVRVTADAAGNFSKTLGAWNNPRDVCVWIAVAPPVGSSAAPTTVTFVPARLEASPDTLEVHIVVPAPPAP